MTIQGSRLRTGRMLRATGHTQVVWSDQAGDEHYERADQRVRAKLPIDPSMRRKSKGYAGAPLHRDHLSSTMGRHVWCESGLEELAMLVADRDPEIVAYACQAVEFIWPRDAAQVSHVVDLIRWRSDGSVELVDSHVKFDDEFRLQADLTRAACEAIGWQYQVFSGLEPTVERNVRWLAADRHRWIVVGREALLARVVELAATPISVVDLCSRAYPESPCIARPIVHYGLWHNLLSMTWQAHFTQHTLVWASKAGRQA